MSYAVIQGSSKGIGLAVTRHLLKNTSLRVVGTTHGPTSFAREAALEGMDDSTSASSKRLTTLNMDVTNEDSIIEVYREIEEKYGRNLRLLANVSGMLHAERSLAEVDAESLMKSFQINTFGHLLVFKHFISLLPSRKSKHQGSSTHSIFEGEHSEEEDTTRGILPMDRSTLVSFSARVGSIADNQKGGWYSYRSSKAATTQIVRTLAHELTMRKLPATAFAYHPGTVKTSLAEPYVGNKDPDPANGLFTPEMAAEKFAGVLKGRVENGAFVDWNGGRIQY